MHALAAEVLREFETPTRSVAVPERAASAVDGAAAIVGRLLAPSDPSFRRY